MGLGDEQVLSARHGMKGLALLSVAQLFRGAPRPPTPVNLTPTLLYSNHQSFITVFSRVGVGLPLTIYDSLTNQVALSTVLLTNAKHTPDFKSVLFL